MVTEAVKSACASDLTEKLRPLVKHRLLKPDQAGPQGRVHPPQVVESETPEGLRFTHLVPCNNAMSSLGIILANPHEAPASFINGA
jgi:hypothetical protein